MKIFKTVSLHHIPPALSQFLKDPRWRSSLQQDCLKLVQARRPCPCRFGSVAFDNVTWSESIETESDPVLNLCKPWTFPEIMVQISHLVLARLTVDLRVGVFISITLSNYLHGTV